MPLVGAACFSISQEENKVRLLLGDYKSLIFSFRWHKMRFQKLCYFSLYHTNATEVVSA